MNRYLLDSNTVIVFQRAGHLDTLLDAAALVPMVIADDVHAELTIPRPGKPMTPELRQAAQALARNVIGVLQIDAGSEADQDRTALRRMNNAGPGEAGSIALAIRRPDLIFVTEDVKAVAGRAKLYRELPGNIGRVLGLHAFLRTLVDRGALAESAALEVAAAARSWSNLEPPLWWAGWAASNVGRPTQ